MTLLDVSALSVTLPTAEGDLQAVRNLSFSVGAGEMFGIVGESGSGKSVLAKSLMGLMPGARRTGRIGFGGQDMTGLAEPAMRRLRGNRIAMIPQDPLSALNPYHSVGRQIAEAVRAHRPATRSEAWAEAVTVLGRVGIADPERRAHDFPHQFSGGMRQRVLIAMAVVLRPELLIADEPTTALDVTVQAQILALIGAMQRETGTAVIMVTHDLHLLSGIADRVMVMYAGAQVEAGAAGAVLRQPHHPYTRGLLASSPGQASAGRRLAAIPGQPPSLLALPPGCAFAPRCPVAQASCHALPPDWIRTGPGAGHACALRAAPVAVAAAAVPLAGPAAVSAASPVIRVEGLRLAYRAPRLVGPAQVSEVLRGVDLTLGAGETLGIVGESGSGKSTLARIIAGLQPAGGGRVEVLGRALGAFDRADWRRHRREVQMVFQDPVGSLNPRRRVGAIIGDPFRIHGICRRAERQARVEALMTRVGLDPAHCNRFPSEFSGGQRQRIGIARALALEPRIVIFDEPVSALDVSIQAQILNLIRDLQRDLGLSYLFISHDLAVVRHVSDRVMVLAGGAVAEEGRTERIFAAPAHPYTRQLLAAARLSPPPLAMEAPA